MAGIRRELLLARGSDFQVMVNAALVALGRRTFALTLPMVHHTGLEIVNVSPEKIPLSIARPTE